MAFASSRQGSRQGRETLACNSVPTLTGLTTPVTFLENTVNAVPQFLAADVTFTDPEDNFGTGTLVVSDCWRRTRCRFATKAPARARSGSPAARHSAAS